MTLVVCPDCAGRGLARTWVDVARIASDPGLAICSTCDGAGRIAERRRAGRGWSRIAVVLAIAWAFAAGWMAGHADAAAPRSAQPVPSPIPAGLAELTGAPILSALPDPFDHPTRRAGSHSLPGDRPTLAGVSSWYCSSSSPCTRGYGPDDLVGAAGPALRAALGPDWRGRVVTVVAGGRSVAIELVDICRCPGDRVVDLTSGAFTRLAPLARGLVRVTVTW